MSEIANKPDENNANDANLNAIIAIYQEMKQADGKVLDLSFKFIEAFEPVYMTYPRGEQGMFLDKYFPGEKRKIQRYRKVFKRKDDVERAILDGSVKTFADAHDLASKLDREEAALKKGLENDLPQEQVAIDFEEIKLKVPKQKLKALKKWVEKSGSTILSEAEQVAEAIEADKAAPQIPFEIELKKAA